MRVLIIAWREPVMIISDQISEQLKIPDGGLGFEALTNARWAVELERPAEPRCRLLKRNFGSASPVRSCTADTCIQHGRLNHIRAERSDCTKRTN
jgi:hypothetical protein